MVAILRRLDYSVLAVILLALSVVAVPLVAMADADAVAGPGATGTIPSNPRGYTQVELTNTGPGPTEVVIKSAAFNKTFTIEEGKTLKLTEIFGPRTINVTNKSTAATVNIHAKWL